MTARIRVGSVCSGIGGAELAFDGATHVFASETEAFPRAVLRRHFPELTIYGDFRDIGPEAGAIDVLVGGTPCQSFSVAGLRRGMADERGNLALEYLRLAQRLRPAWVLWENVPGVLSSNEGRDFGAFVGGLAECGYGWAYRVLDAQHFGLAQRRKRVFVVGCLGDWRRAAAVLFEPASLRGHPAPCREAREGIANALTERADRGGTNSEGQRLIAGTLAPGAHPGGFNGRDATGNLIAYGGNNTSGSIDVAAAVRGHNGSGWHGDFDSETFIAHSLGAHSAGQATEDGTGRGVPLVAHSLRADGFDVPADGTGRGTPLVAFTLHGADKTVSTATETDVAGSIRTKPPGSVENSSTTAIMQHSLVRRLTPTECERLQGFPDGWTDVAYRGRAAADGPRYRALGNAFAVPVVRWIARRIAREHAADALLAEAAD